MNRFINVSVDVDAMADEAFAFVVDPSPGRNERSIVQELNDFNPELVDVLECMVLDGTEERGDVLAFLTAVFSGGFQTPEAQREADRSGN